MKMGSCVFSNKGSVPTKGERVSKQQKNPTQGRGAETENCR